MGHLPRIQNIWNQQKDILPCNCDNDPYVMLIIYPYIHISIYHISIYPYIHISYIYISTHQSINIYIYISKFHIVAPLFPIVSDIVSTAHLGHGASDLQHPQVPTATGQRSQWTPRLGNEKDAVPKGLHHGHFVKGCIAHVTCII